MKKVREYDPSKRIEYLSKVWVNGAESAEKCTNIRDKILEAAKLKPRYEEKAAIHSKAKTESQPRGQERSQAC
jgi:tRNA (guanine10-N2)-methyltransferase